MCVCVMVERSALFWVSFGNVLYIAWDYCYNEASCMLSVISLVVDFGGSPMCEVHMQFMLR